MTAPPPIDPKLVSLLWAGADRAADIAALHARLFDPPWSADSFKASLDHPGSTAFIATIGGPNALAGFIVGTVAADEAEILTIGVAKEIQRRGIAARLVDGFIRAVARAEARKVHLEVADDNIAAMALYRRLGFEETGRRKAYYQRSGSKAADAVTMARAV